MGLILDNFTDILGKLAPTSEVGDNNDPPVPTAAQKEEERRRKQEEARGAVLDGAGAMERGARRLFGAEIESIRTNPMVAAARGIYNGATTPDAPPPPSSRRQRSGYMPPPRDPKNPPVYGVQRVPRTGYHVNPRYIRVPQNDAARREAAGSPPYDLLNPPSMGEIIDRAGLRPERTVGDMMRDIMRRRNAEFKERFSPQGRQSRGGITVRPKGAPKRQGPRKVTPPKGSALSAAASSPSVNTLSPAEQYAPKSSDSTVNTTPSPATPTQPYFIDGNVVYDAATGEQVGMTPEMAAEENRRAANATPLAGPPDTSTAANDVSPSDAGPRVPAVVTAPPSLFQVEGGPRRYQQQNVYIGTDPTSKQRVVLNRVANPEFQRKQGELQQIILDQQGLQEQFDDPNTDDTQRAQLAMQINAGDSRAKILQGELQGMRPYDETPVATLASAIANDREFGYQYQKEELNKQLEAALEDPEGQDDAATLRRRLAELEYNYQKNRPADTKRFGWKDQLKGLAAGALQGLASGGGLGAALGGAGVGFFGSMVDPDLENKLWDPYRMRKYEERYKTATEQEQAVLAQQKAQREAIKEGLDISGKRVDIEGKQLVNEGQFIKNFREKVENHELYKAWKTGQKGFEVMTPEMAAIINRDTGGNSIYPIGQTYRTGNYVLAKFNGRYGYYDPVADKINYVTNARGEYVYELSEVPKEFYIGNQVFMLPSDKAAAIQSSIAQTNVREINESARQQNAQFFEAQKLAYQQAVDLQKAFANAAAEASLAESEKIKIERFQGLVREKQQALIDLGDISTDEAKQKQYEGIAKEIDRLNVSITEAIGKNTALKTAYARFATQYGLEVYKSGPFVGMPIMPAPPRLPTATAARTTTLASGMLEVPAPPKKDEKKEEKKEDKKASKTKKQSKKK